MADTPNLSGPSFGTIAPVATPRVPNAWEASNARLKREESTSTSDYVGSMLRQDGIIDGAMAALVGSQMTPQPGYFAGSDKDYENLKKDLWPEHIAELYKAVSPAHALYLKDRLLQKQTDMVRLGDLGVPGNIGRFALGVVAPDNLVWALTGGWAAKGVQTIRNAGMSQVGKALVGAEARVAAGKAPAVAAGIGVGATENLAFEALRQSVNFEDSNLQLAEAFLFGGAFTAPFALAGARGARLMEQAANREVSSLKAFQKMEQGQALEPHEAKVVKETVEIHSALNDLHAGKIDEEAFNARVDRALTIEEDATQFLSDLSARLGEQGRSIISEVFPNAGQRRPAPAREQFEMPASHAEIDAFNRDNPPVQGPGVAAFRKLLDERREAATKVANDASKKQELEDLWSTIEKTRATQKAKETELALSQRDLQTLERGLDLEDPRIVAAKAEAEAPKATIEAATATTQPPATVAPAMPTTPEAPQRVIYRGTNGSGEKIKGGISEGSLFAAASEKVARSYAGSGGRVEKIGVKSTARILVEGSAEYAKVTGRRKGKLINTMRKGENLKTAGDDVVEKARAAGYDAFEFNSMEDLGIVIFNEAQFVRDMDGQAPPEPQVTAESFVGREVSFQAKDGSTVEGTVTGISPATGKLLVKDDLTGKVKSVAHTDVDQYAPMSETPEGFLPGSIGAAKIAEIANVATQRTAMAKYRADYYAILNGSSNPQVRELAYRLIKDAIQNDDKVAQGWTASEYKKNLQRVIGGNFHRALGEAYAKAVELGRPGVLQRGAFKTQFMELVARETRGDKSVAADHATIHPAIAQGAKAMRDAYAQALEQMKRAGVKGADEVPTNDLYVNRQWRFDRIREAIAAHGEDTVVALLARSINVPGHGGDLVKARRFLNTVRKLEYSAAAQNIALQPRDMGTLRTELAQHGLTPDEINDLVDVMFDARASSADSGQMGHMKFRFDIDETMAEGNLRIQDLFENDARTLIDTYLNSVGGHIGLAKVGIRSSEDWKAAVKAVQEEPGAMADPKLGKELELLEDIYKHITGRPMSSADFSNTARIAQAVRGMTRSITLGQLGITAAFEMHKAMAMFGVRAMMQSMPSFGGFFKAIRKGYVPEKGLAEDIMMMTGFGNEMAASYARALELEGGFAGGVVSRWEHWSNKASHVTDILSGNASFTAMTRHMSAMGATRQAFEVATGKRKLTAAEKRRWVGQGVSDNPTMVPDFVDAPNQAGPNQAMAPGKTMKALEGTSDLEMMLGGLKDHAVVGPNGRLESIRFEDWQANDRGSYELFQLFLSRQVRDAIQDHDIGETMPWMHTTIGKMFAELKTFMLVAHAKNFLKNLEYRDATSLNLLMVGIMSESLAYSLQTAINFPDELDKRLTADRIAQAVASRMSMGGFSSVIAATGYHLLTGGDPLFGDGITANTDTRLAFKPPSAVTMEKLINAPATLMGLLGTDVSTRKEVRDFLTLAPGSRLPGVPFTIRYLTEGLPTADPENAR